MTRVFIAGTKGFCDGCDWVSSLMEERWDERVTRVHIAGTNGGTNIPRLFGDGWESRVAPHVNLLESFFYVKDWQTRNIHRFKSFILDSGAFTFRESAGRKRVDWDEYIDRYAAYVRENKVGNYFDLDIDMIVGYERVVAMRRRLESLVGWPCMPVWHLSYGKDEWLRLCDEYDYVAIGGIAGRNGGTNIERYLPWFTKEAHRRGTMVHGLGYTRLDDLPRCNFDTVDSTAWLYGNRGGFLYFWDGSRMNKVDKPEGKRMNSKAVAQHNFMEWVKMAEDLEGR